MNPLIDGGGSLGQVWCAALASNVSFASFNTDVCAGMTVLVDECSESPAVVT